MTAPASSRDRPAIITLPPLIYLAGIVLGFLLESWWPTTFGPRGGSAIVGAMLVALGGLVILWSERTMARAGTSPKPWKATVAIVDSGPYAFSRNPMYVAFALVHVGVAAIGDSVWVLAFLLPVLVMVHRGVVRPEEAYLRAKFGAPYEEYLQRVGRWLGPR